MMSDGEIQFGFMPKEGAIDAVVTVRRLQELCHANTNKFCICAL